MILIIEMYVVILFSFLKLGCCDQIGHGVLFFGEHRVEKTRCLLAGELRVAKDAFPSLYVGGTLQANAEAESTAADLSFGRKL